MSYISSRENDVGLVNKHVEKKRKFIFAKIRNKFHEKSESKSKQKRSKSHIDIFNLHGDSKTSNPPDKDGTNKNPFEIVIPRVKLPTGVLIENKPTNNLSTQDDIVLRKSKNFVRSPLRHSLAAGEDFRLEPIPDYLSDAYAENNKKMNDLVKKWENVSSEKSPPIDYVQEKTSYFERKMKSQNNTNNPNNEKMTYEQDKNKQVSRVNDVCLEYEKAIKNNKKKKTLSPKVQKEIANFQKRVPSHDQNKRKQSYDSENNLRSSASDMEKSHQRKSVALMEAIDKYETRDSEIKMKEIRNSTFNDDMVFIKPRPKFSRISSPFLVNKRKLYPIQESELESDIIQFSSLKKPNTNGQPNTHNLSPKTETSTKNEGNRISKPKFLSPQMEEKRRILQNLLRGNTHSSNSDPSELKNEKSIHLKPILQQTETDNDSKSCNFNDQSAEITSKQVNPKNVASLNKNKLKSLDLSARFTFPEISENCKPMVLEENCKPIVLEENSTISTTEQILKQLNEDDEIPYCSDEWDSSPDSSDYEDALDEFEKYENTSNIISLADTKIKQIRENQLLKENQKQNNDEYIESDEGNEVFYTDKSDKSNKVFIEKENGNEFVIRLVNYSIYLTFQR